MLKISLTPGEYLTIGENVVVQLYRSAGGRAYLAIQAPRDVSILRGTVLERQGGERPQGLMNVLPKGSHPDDPLSFLVSIGQSTGREK